MIPETKTPGQQCGEQQPVALTLIPLDQQVKANEQATANEVVVRLVTRRLS